MKKFTSYRYWLNEKFTEDTEDSDAIRDDMGIGIKYEIDKFMKNDIEEYEYDDDATTKDLNIILGYSLAYEKEDFVKYLISKGAKVNDNPRVTSWFHFACRYNHPEMVKLLLKYKFDFHGDGVKGFEKGLRIAVANDQLPIVKILVEAGADMHAANDMPIRLAIAKDYVDITKYFREKGIKFTLKLIKVAIDTDAKNVMEYMKDSIKKERKKKLKKFFHIKENLYEKFTDESDPIQDMGIGMKCKRNFNSREKMHEWIIDHLSYILGTEKIPKNILYDSQCYINQKYQDKIEDYVRRYLTLNNTYDFWTFQPYMFAEMMINKGYQRGESFAPREKRTRKKSVIKKNVNEKFTEDSDPIIDMGIGIMAKIDELLKEKYRGLYSSGDSTRDSLSAKLMACVQLKNEQFVEFLISKTTYADQLYPFQMSIRFGYLNIVKIFVNGGILKNSGFTNIYYDSMWRAVHSAKSEILKYLFDEVEKNGVKISQYSLDNLLSTSCRYVYTKSARILLDHGAKISDSKLKRAISRWLLKGKKTKVTNLLKQYNLI